MNLGEWLNRLIEHRWSVLEVGALVFVLLLVALFFFIKKKSRPKIGLSQLKRESPMPDLADASEARIGARGFVERTNETPGKAQRHGASPAPRFLTALPFVKQAGLTRDVAQLYGMTVCAVFFDESVNRRLDPVARLLPFLPSESAQLVTTESQRRNFRAPELCAQPDAVFETQEGFIALEFKGRSGRGDDRERWQEALRVNDLLQTLLEAAAVSIETHRPCAAVLRTVDALYYLLPSQELVDFICDRLPEACRFMETKDLPASDAAKLLAVPLTARWPLPEAFRQNDGEARHRAMLG